MLSLIRALPWNYNLQFQETQKPKLTCESKINNNKNKINKKKENKLKDDVQTHTVLVNRKP